MSIERVMLLDYLKIHPELIGVHGIVTKMKPISGFSTIPYIVDFGVIITGSTVFIIKFQAKFLLYKKN